jgi:membrane protease YdiL (CAAX protease family)
VPQDVLTEVGRLAVAGAIVAAGAVPAGLAAAVVVYRSGRRLLPRWSVPGAPKLWGDLPTLTSDVGFLLLVVFLFVAYPVLVGAGSGVLRALGVFDLPPAAAGPDGEPLEQLRAATGTIIAAPVLLSVWLWLRHRCPGGMLPQTGGELARQVTLGIVTWAVVAPLVFAVHLFTTWITERFGAEPDEHPFSRLTSGLTPLDQALFVVLVCLATPLAEEVLFRGLFIGWTGGRWYRPWALLVLAAVPAVTVGVGLVEKIAPLVFVVVLAVGLYAVQRIGSARPGFPSRTVVSVYATAALFAAAHSRVWPSPVPLFVLGLALGYLATRTNRIAACVVLHGLFNAVSFVYVLRGGSG